MFVPYEFAVFQISGPGLVGLGQSLSLYQNPIYIVNYYVLKKIILFYASRLLALLVRFHDPGCVAHFIFMTTWGEIILNSPRRPFKEIESYRNIRRDMCLSLIVCYNPYKLLICTNFELLVYNWEKQNLPGTREFCST